MEKWPAARPSSIVDGAPAPKKAPAGPAKPAVPQYTKVFGEALVAECRRDERVCGITAAMNSGTGLDILQKALPERYYDVGIAEQHAVLFAAGLALQGMKPVAAIYSTFLQRAYDYGVPLALGAARLLEQHGIEATVADARFAKPLDVTLAAALASDHELLV